MDEGTARGVAPPAGVLRTPPTDGRALRLRGEREQFDLLVGALRRGLFAGRDAACVLEHTLRAFGLAALVLGDEWSYEPWVHVAGDLGDWPRVYQPIRDSDPSRALLLDAPYGTYYIASSHSDHLLYPLLRRCGFVDVLLFRLPSPRGSQLVVGMFRGNAAAPFDDDDLSALGLLHPHLALAFRTRTALRAFDRPRDESRERFFAGDEPYAFVELPRGRIDWSAGALDWWSRRREPMTATRRRSLDRALLRASRLPERTHRLPGGVEVDFCALSSEDRQSVRLLALFTEGRVPSAPESAAEECLTAREREVARLFATGLSASEVAARLDMRPQTARVHLRNVYAKLEVGNRAALIRLLSPG